MSQAPTLPSQKPFNIVDKMNMLNHIKIMMMNLDSWATYVTTIPVQTPCQNCTFFEESGNCKKWQSAVPVEAQPEGCENFFYNTNSAPF
jgi:hypothetical protein